MKIEHSSAATAFVTGVVALVRERYPTMTPAQVMQRLKLTAGHGCGLPQRTFIREVWGYGSFGPLVDPVAALGGVCDKGISGPAAVHFNSPSDPPQQIQLTALHTADAALQYLWDNGDQAQTGTFWIYPSSAYGVQTTYPIWVEVTDPTSGMKVLTWHTVRVTTGEYYEPCPGPNAC